MYQRPGIAVWATVRVVVIFQSERAMSTCRKLSLRGFGLVAEFEFEDIAIAGANSLGLLAAHTRWLTFIALYSFSEV